MAKIKKKNKRYGMNMPESGFENPHFENGGLEPDEESVLRLFGAGAVPPESAEPVGNVGKRKKTQTYSLARLQEIFGVRRGRGRRLEESLAGLTAAGKLIRLKGPSFTLPDGLRQIAGKLRVRRQGMGFVKPDGGGCEIYIHPSQMNGAWDGDTVVIGLLPGQSGKNSEGRVLSVLERGRREIPVRLLPQRVRENGKIKQLARPLSSSQAGGPDPRFGGYLLVDLEDLLSHGENAGRDAEPPRKNHAALREGDMVLAAVLNPDELEGEEKAADGVVRARAVAALDRENSLALYERMVKADHGIATEFPAASLEEAGRLPEDPNPEAELAPPAEESGAEKKSPARRRDLRGLDFVTIDGADARDFDDAILARTSQNGFELLVAIADVAHYVRPDSALDAEAKSRGNSCYFPASVEPMLPRALSNGLCSLKPGKPRLALVARMEFGSRGERLDSEFFPALIESKARLTYEAVQTALDSASGSLRRKAGEKKASADTPEPGTEPMPQALLSMLETAGKLASVLRRQRIKRGALDFDLPEPKVSLDETGRVLRPEFRPRLFAHRLIEEFMLAANEAAAEYLEAQELRFLYRAHPAPETDKLRELFKTLEKNSLLPPGPVVSAQARKNPGPHELQELLELARGLAAQAHASDCPEDDSGVETGAARPSLPRGGEFVVNRLVLRALTQAHYTPAREGHFGLASPAYCHFTSPIRRYADLAVHRVLRFSLGLGGLNPALSRLFELAEGLNKAERNAVEAERDIYKTCAAIYLSGKVGEIYQAVVTGLSSFGIFAELSEFPAEGFIPLELIDGDFYHFDAASQTLRGLGRGRSFRLGQGLTVRLEEADAMRREIRFSLAGENTVAFKSKKHPRGVSRSLAETVSDKPGKGHSQRRTFKPGEVRIRKGR